MDWLQHYRKKIKTLEFSAADLTTFYNQDRELIHSILAFAPKRILEAGAGLARDALVIAARGVSVTLFDNNQKLLSLAEENAERLRLKRNITTQRGDLFSLAATVAKNDYDLVYSAGVLEHFEDEDIKEILKQELQVAPVVVFTVPIDSARNRAYFNDSVFHRLLPFEYWKKLLSEFHAVEIKLVSSRHDDVLAILRR